MQIDYFGNAKKKEEEEHSPNCGVVFLVFLFYK